MLKRSVGVLSFVDNAGRTVGAPGAVGATASTVIVSLARPVRPAVSLKHVKIERDPSPAPRGNAFNVAGDVNAAYDASGTASQFGCTAVVNCFSPASADVMTAVTLVDV